jgi:hypothetical protein
MLKDDYGLVKDRGNERYALGIGGVEALFEKIHNFTVDVKEDDNNVIRRTERLCAERLMWLTKDLSDPDNISKFHIEFHKDFNRILLQFQNQILKKKIQYQQVCVSIIS